MKRVVSLVPSWTETLIAAGANVVGRTRFCVHPHESVTSIAAIGGTKSFDIEKLRALKPDLIILDREENTREMAELAQTIAPLHVTHVESVQDMPRELNALATLFKTSASDENVAREFRSLGDRFAKILARPAPVLHKTSFVYCIWKDPWMAVGRNTFIASMLEQSGYDLDLMWPQGAEKYPKFEIADVPLEMLVMLSSEPYPFAQKRPQLPHKDVALVDGESFSWFGIRSLRYLEGLR